VAKTTGAHLQLTRAQVRAFLLDYHRLRPPRSTDCATGLISTIKHLGCIQYDPINKINPNANLVLQARLAGFQSTDLEQALYQTRTLVDGFDKVASIYPIEDWPYFHRRRERAWMRHKQLNDPAFQASSSVLERIRQEGPLSSLDFKGDHKTAWLWGKPTSVARAALELLNAAGHIGVHHRVGSRRVYDLIERLLPPEIAHATDPHADEDSYQEWHIMRRIAGIGLANPAATQYWGGIPGVNGSIRREVLTRLTAHEELRTCEIEDVPNRIFYIRTVDQEHILTAANTAPAEKAAFIAPLDNFTWDRDLLRWMFDFDYIWEVYKPVKQRRFGYYVLPVILGDRFIARFDSSMNRKSGRLELLGWWWESGFKIHDQAIRALQDAFHDFLDFLDASGLDLDAPIKQRTDLKWLHVLS